MGLDNSGQVKGVGGHQPAAAPQGQAVPVTIPPPSILRSFIVSHLSVSLLLFILLLLKALLNFLQIQLYFDFLFLLYLNMFSFNMLSHVKPLFHCLIGNFSLDHLASPEPRFRSLDLASVHELSLNFQCCHLCKILLELNKHLNQVLDVVFQHSLLHVQLMENWAWTCHSTCQTWCPGCQLLESFLEIF